MAVSHSSLIGSSVSLVRDAIRTGNYRGHTAGLATGKLQANLVILPAAFARDFEEYCQLNSQACPLVGKTEPGNPLFRQLGEIDLRSDVPAYNLYRDGELTESVNDIQALWQDDFVGFALGCSFSFERALIEHDLPMHHIEADRTVPMYRTNIDTRPKGRFSGEMVVSMRLLPADKVQLARDITARYPWAHGAPVHAGDASLIGVNNLDTPDWGDPPVGQGTPVFWGCGVTPQNALSQAKLPLCITHQPGCMLITDIDDTANAFLHHTPTD